MRVLKLLSIVLLVTSTPLAAQSLEYRVLAATRTSTMEKELNEHAGSGFRLQTAMGGQRLFAGKEVAVIMARPSGQTEERYRYRLLATNKTSTMESELQSAARDGYEYRAQTVFDTALAGKEVIVILEKDLRETGRGSEYMLLATNRTSTMDKELAAAGSKGFEVLGLTVAETAFGGNELIAILRRPRS